MPSSFFNSFEYMSMRVFGQMALEQGAHGMPRRLVSANDYAHAAGSVPEFVGNSRRSRRQGLQIGLAGGRSPELGRMTEAAGRRPRWKVLGKTRDLGSVAVVLAEDDRVRQPSGTLNLVKR